jgi:hypothetical protein
MANCVDGYFEGSDEERSLVPGVEDFLGQVL